MRKKVWIPIVVAVMAMILYGAVKISDVVGARGWTERYADVLDTFFGEGDWECTDTYTSKSLVLEYTYRDQYGADETVNGRYRSWDILYTGGGSDETYTISNHVYKLNHQKYILPSKRYTAREAVIRELFDIALDISAERVVEEDLASLSEGERSALVVYVSYTGGNPPLSFYDELIDQEWFNIGEVCAGDFLSTDLYDFDIDIMLYEYYFNKLSGDEQDEFMDSGMDRISSDLLDKYGDDATFEIYFDPEHQVEYEDGVRAD